MERFSMLFCLIMMVVMVNAQDRQIKMPEAPKQEKYTEFTLKDKGYWCSVEFGVAPSVRFHETCMWTSTLSFVNGYRFNDYLRLGVGIGAGYYFANNDVARDTDIRWTMPIFVNARGNFISQEVREIVPFWSVDIGGAVRDGFLFTPSVGCRIGERRSAFLASLGYSYRGIDAKKGLSSNRSFIVLKIGYEF